MSSWALVVTLPALKDLEKVPKRDRDSLEAGIDHLAVDPYSGDVKKLAAGKDLWRLRVGTWRVRFRVDKSSRTVYVVRVLPSAVAYRDL